MTNLFTQIDSVLASLEGWGWCSREKAYHLAASVLTLRPKVVVEVGVFGGRSLFPMALACQAVGYGKVIGIDPWVAVASVQGQVNAADRDFWDKCDHEKVYLKFLSVRQQFGLEGVIDVQRMISDYYEPPPVIDLWHCDGNHSIQALRDVQRFAPNVRIGGLVFADDLNWSGGGVMEAYKFLLSTGFSELYRLDTGAMLQRVSR